MRITQFRVENYRSIKSTGWIDVNALTAFIGQNEAGKSNLCEALYRVNPYVDDTYNVDEDWPVDDWGNKSATSLVCEARFIMDDPVEIKTFLTEVGSVVETQPGQPQEAADATKVFVATGPELPTTLKLKVSRFYNNSRKFFKEIPQEIEVDTARAEAWARTHLPKCVYIRDYDLPGSQVELDALSQKLKQQGWSGLSNEEQTIMIVLQLANVNLDDFLAKGASPDGRTLRSFDKRQASAYLTAQFAKLWGQKEVRFDIEIDGPTLNIFVEDAGCNMPVRLKQRSTGFRWHVAFAWKFTHATKGEYKNCIIMLEEPGVHLHYAAHKDLLQVLGDLSSTNTILYTTHIPTMLDQAFPERVRIVEIINHDTKVVTGVVSSQRTPMMLIEARLGLTGNMSGLLGNRQTLVVEGGDDALILQKLSGIFAKSGKAGLSDRIYLWPAEGASKTPMWAGFLVGQKFDAGVLLDSDKAGEDAKKKIGDLYLKPLATDQKFRVFMLRETAGITKNEAAIEDIFPDDFYLACVNEAYGINITSDDLPKDGSDQISKRVEVVLKERHGRSELDKKLVMSRMLNHFDGWSSIDDLPSGTAERAGKLFTKINAEFA